MRGLVQQWNQTGCADSEYRGSGMSRRNRAANVGSGKGTIPGFGNVAGGYVHDTVTRFMGLIVIAMKVQFALSGMRSFMVETDHAAP